MFVEHGFDAVRVAGVGEACGVSEKTVFNYFPSKEALLLDRLEDPPATRPSAAGRDRRRGPGRPPRRPAGRGRPDHVPGARRTTPKQDRPAASRVRDRLNTRRRCRRAHGARLLLPHRIGRR
ncbi:MAG TPA: helix-turn-helix domain-containing protein [Kutzneria sp.]|nr:helix-turn-helix domain-containing protein [Kutzneria sp.]